MRHGRVTLTLLLAATFGGGALAQDIQTSNDWAVGAAHGAVIDSINRENVKRLRGKPTPRSQPSRSKPAETTTKRWTPTERAQNCAFLGEHLDRLTPTQLHQYQTVCG